MSFFDVFEVDQRAVQDTWARLRARYPEATLQVAIEDGVVVVSGATANEEDRRAILDAFRNINPGLTPVVGGALDARNPTSPRGRNWRNAGQWRLLGRVDEISRRTTQRIYRVQRGDTLQSIAIKFYSDPKALRLICASNGEVLCSPKQVQAGTMLTVPEALYHLVTHGETLEMLALRYYQDAGMISALTKANPELAQQGYRPEPGSTVRIPLKASPTDWTK